MESCPSGTCSGELGFLLHHNSRIQVNVKIGGGKQDAERMEVSLAPLIKSLIPGIVWMLRLS